MNHAFPHFVLRTLVLSLLMLISLSVCMWLMAYYSSEQQPAQTSLIYNAQANMLALPSPTVIQPSLVNPAINATNPVSKNPTHIDSSTQFLHYIEATDSATARIILQFSHENPYLNETERLSLRRTLDQADIARQTPVKITAGAISNDQRVNQERALKLRTQSIARLIFAHTQRVEIALDQTLPHVGQVTVEFAAH